MTDMRRRGGGPPTDAVHDAAGELLHRAGQRYTATRRRLLEVLAGAGRPLAIPEILAAGGVAQSSLYRNLTDLERAGVVRQVPGPGEFARYELGEGLTEHHHHLVCNRCGKVEDVVVPPAAERALARAVQAITKETGFEVDSHAIDLKGTCRRCARA